VGPLWARREGPDRGTEGGRNRQTCPMNRSPDYRNQLIGIEATLKIAQIQISMLRDFYDAGERHYPPATTMPPPDGIAVNCNPDGAVFCFGQRLPPDRPFQRARHADVGVEDPRLLRKSGYISEHRRAWRGIGPSWTVVSKTGRLRTRRPAHRCAN